MGGTPDPVPTDSAQSFLFHQCVSVVDMEFHCWSPTNFSPRWGGGTASSFLYRRARAAYG